MEWSGSGAPARTTSIFSAALGILRTSLLLTLMIITVPTMASTWIAKLFLIRKILENCLVRSAVHGRAWCRDCDKYTLLRCSTRSCISASPFAAVTTPVGSHLDHDGTESRPPPRQFMQVLPKSWGGLRYIHASTRTYATLAELRNARINAFVHLSDDSKPRADSPDGPLSGMAVAVKDNICTSDMPTTCSSPMLKGASRVSSSFRTGPNF